MSDPVAGTSQAPTFGGLSGYKRPAPGKPTSVPGGLPAFRGRRANPGDQVRTPAIQASKNQHWRPTNVTIPYSRICPIDHLANVGRISPGDVVFTSRYRVAEHHVATQRQQRVVGVDFLNKGLGNDNKMRVPGSPIHPQWVVNETVLLGGNSAVRGAGAGVGERVDYDPIGSLVADNWRECAFLREWVCDGVVLSNDEPYAHTSNGQRDVQLFNICVQGRCAANNGYVDFAQKGVESYHRSQTDRNGYKDDGEPGRPHDFGTAIGGPYYQSYPLQMFDRKIKPLSDVYVGLVATKRRLTPAIKAALLANSSILPGTLDHRKLTAVDEDNDWQTFYTFKFVYFSDRAMWAQSASLSITSGDYVSPDGSVSSGVFAEPPTKRQRPVHRSDALRDPIDKSYDQFAPVSADDYRGMVGAWRIGKVLDTAARRKDQYMGGPVDTADQITLNVSLEWMDWRALRRRNERLDIGMYVAGAPLWNVRAIAIPVLGGYADVDDGRTLQWPTAYVLPTDKPIKEAVAAAVAAVAPGAGLAGRRRQAAVTTERDERDERNIPLDMQELTTVAEVRARAAVEAAALAADQAAWDAAYPTAALQADAALRGEPRPVDPIRSYARDGMGRPDPTAPGNRGTHTLKYRPFDQMQRYQQAANAAHKAGQDGDWVPAAVQRRIQVVRALDTTPAIDGGIITNAWRRMAQRHVPGGRGATNAAKDALPITQAQFEGWWATLTGTGRSAPWILMISGRQPPDYYGPTAARTTQQKWNARNARRRADARYHFTGMRYMIGDPNDPDPVLPTISKDNFTRYINAKLTFQSGTGAPDPSPEDLVLVGGAAEDDSGLQIVLERMEDGPPLSEGELAIAAALHPDYEEDQTEETAQDPTAGPMDTGEGVGLSFGISAAAVPPAPKSRNRPATASGKAAASSSKAPAVAPKPSAAVATLVAPTPAPTDAPVAPKPAAAAKAPAVAPKPVAATGAAPAETAAEPRAGRPGGSRPARAGVSGTEEIFSTIFGSTAPAGAAQPPAAPPAGDDSDASSDHAPSPAAGGSRSRVRRARDGR